MNDRGRVPFALVGVLLVLTSTTLAVTVVPQTGEERPDIDRAMDDATAIATTELRAAADEAATKTASAPVTRPADTVAGQALDDDRPFRDALRLRIYLYAIERLDGTETTHGDTTVRVSLPSVEPTTRGYRTAIERVEIERAGADEAALSVEIDGVTLSAIRGGRTVETIERSPTFTVANPALLLHDRTERFETRANAPVTREGLGRRLTARLYPIAWTRGYAQYGGAPIATVLGTRHVELATNDALLAEQRAAFGEADPDGHRGTAAAGRRVATTDMLVGVGGDEEWQDVVLETADDIGPDPPADQPVGTWRDEPDDPTVTVGVNASADRAFADLVGVTGDDELATVIERAHTVEARIETETTRRRWVRGNETTVTRDVRKRTYRVGVAVQARTEPIEGVPRGRLDGHLQSAADRAAERALADAGGFRVVAETAADGRTDWPEATAKSRPAFDRETVESELATLREETRDVSVTLPATAVGTGRADPARRLREKLSEDGRFFAPPGPTPAERTLRAGQRRYLDALGAELRERESIDDRTGNGIEDALGEYLGTDRLDGALAAHRAARRPDPEPLSDPAGNLSLAVDTAPSYLTTRAVSRDRIDERGGGTVYPLSTRTVNLFTSPHDQVASGIVGRIPFLGTEHVPLSTAARTLAAVDEGPKRDRLEGEVEAATAHVRGELIAEMVDAGVAEHEARAALAHDGSSATEALRLTDGTTIERASTEVSGTVSADRLELRLRTRLETVLEEESARPRKATTTAVQERTRTEYSDELENVLADGIETGGERARKRALGERLGALPAGLPIAPVPGY
ncbi:hypothetical protein KM295_00290 [Natronomonas sp. F2-12]|uniref:Uncharacterized protein n=1 Tax=Natronomonas aquatica TaxID=2841590 RepID=A0A9R1CQP3_9EURY|nr:hypothetical protein [Natronomonas aquatica]MCQ4331944.1 hypothetical protein [Natronomonas aquatica]